MAIFHFTKKLISSAQQLFILKYKLLLKKNPPVLLQNCSSVAMKCCRIWKPFPESLDLNWNLSNDLAMHNNYASNLNIKEVYLKDCLVHSISTKSKSLNSSNLFIFSPSYQAGKSLLDCFVLVSFLLCFFSLGYYSWILCSVCFWFSS